MSISSILTGFNISRELPKIAIYAGFGILIGFLLFGKGFDCKGSGGDRIDSVRSSGKPVVNPMAVSESHNTLWRDRLRILRESYPVHDTVSLCAFAFSKADTTIFMDSIKFGKNWYAVNRKVTLHRSGLIDCANKAIFDDSIGFSFDQPQIKADTLPYKPVQSFMLPELTKLFSWDISASIGAGFGTSALVRGNVSATFFGKYEIGLEPSLFYQDKARGGLVGVFTYHFKN